MFARALLSLRGTAPRSVALTPCFTRSVYSAARVQKAAAEEVKILKKELANFESQDDVDSYIQANDVKTGFDAKDGTITLELKRSKFDVKITYNSEFEYPEENEETNEYEEDEANANQEGDEEAGAFHRIKVDVSAEGETGPIGFSAEGTINMSGNFLIDSVVPFSNSDVLRTVPLSDMSEAAVEKFEIALEELALDQETCDFLPLYARHLRILGHRKSLETLADFFTLAKQG